MSSTPSPEQLYLDMIKARCRMTEREATEIFDQLKAIEPTFLLGEWEGGDFDTGHPASQLLKDINWVGKTFRSEHDVDPIMVRGENGSRTFLEPYGHAQLREVKFRGVISAAMIYDIKPIIDYFRYVDDDTVAGMMDAKEAPAGYHFHLKRCRKTTT
ncbi:hypothetical protein C8R46DRAFT_1038374 [Mycena filopes]|nr:hypothetical protein C8R46DRAFT_1038374 [Mycena filopes]